MIYLCVLIPWGCLAVISFVTDSLMIYRTLTGCNGKAALTLFRHIAERHGGMRRWIAIQLMWDIFEPWLIWQGMLSARR